MITGNDAFILADGRWQGQHGIGRFSKEILSRLQHADILNSGPAPLSIKNYFWQSYYLHQQKNQYKIFFNPGFNPIGFSPLNYVITLHDLIPLHLKLDALYPQKKLFFDFFIKPSARKAFQILTVSNYSKQSILDWINLPPEKVTVVNCGLSHHFTVDGPKHQPGFPYLFHVSNNKKHKNVTRLLIAFANAAIDQDIKLICTHPFTRTQQALIEELNLRTRVICNQDLSEQTLAAYYRGALGLVFPSLYEGFGLPVIEAMASGAPVLTSNVTSLPEVAGDAAILVNPNDTSAIAYGINQLVNNTELRQQLISQGMERAKLYSWNKTANIVQGVLNAAR